jgi:hypothetical protein
VVLGIEPPSHSVVDTDCPWITLFFFLNYIFIGMTCFFLKK